MVTEKVELMGFCAADTASTGSMSAARAVLAHGSIFCQWRSPGDSSFYFSFLPPVCFLHRLFYLFSLPCSHWWRILVFCLGATPPLRCCQSAYLRIPLFFSSFLLSALRYLICFSSLPSLFEFRFGRRLGPFFFLCMSSCLLRFCCEYVSDM